LTFEWDEAKNASTISARGIDFEYASTVFGDENRIELFSRLVGPEARYLCTGKTPVGELLTVIYTWRHYGEETVCRIISARKARKKERSRYSIVH
jgi:uncharacterized DUF497 family protein